MSANQPTSFRYPFSHSNPETDKMGRLLFNGLLDVNNAIRSLNTKVNKNAGAIAAQAATTTPTVSAGGSGTGTVTGTHSEPLTDGNSNFIFAGGDIVCAVGVPD